MAQMIRKQIYIEPRQEETLKRTARMLGLTEAEVIRRAIDQQMLAVPRNILDLGAWERETAFIVERIGAGAVSKKRQWRREDAYEERLARYGR